MAEEKEGAGSKPSEKDKGDAAGADKKAAAGGGGNKMVFWGIIAAILVLEIPIMFFTIKLTRPKPAQEAKAGEHTDSLKESHEEKTVESGEMMEKPIEAIVNIAGTDSERFLKAVVILEYSDPEAAALKAKGGGGGGHGGGPAKSHMATELEKRVPKFKSMLIDLLSTKTLVELNEPDAKEKIRKEFIRLANSTIPPESHGKVIDALFDQFIIQ